VCSKVQVQKNTGIFDEGSINGIDGHILERKMGYSVITLVPATQQALHEETIVPKSL
jgi:hypothetical protein